LPIANLSFEDAEVVLPKHIGTTAAILADNRITGSPFALTSTTPVR
jgi:hypothetical protein